MIINRKLMIPNINKNDIISQIAKSITNGTSSPFFMISSKVFARSEPDLSSSLRRSPDDK